MVLDAYAFDIETDGLIEPTPTSFALFTEGKVVAGLRENGKHSADLGKLHEELGASYPDHAFEISLSITQSWGNEESGLASLIHNAFWENVRDSDTLVTYNGLRYRGGFDVPVLNYAFFKAGVSNPLNGKNHVDVYDTVKRGHIHSTVPEFPSRGGPSKGDMQGAAEMFGLEEEADGLNKAPLADLLNSSLSPDNMAEWAEEYELELPTSSAEDLDSVYAYYYDYEFPDPFESSKEAVTAWESGNYLDLLVHNITDVIKTYRMYEFIEQSAIPAKNYSPTRLG